MSESGWKVSGSVTFGDAVAFTKSLLDEMAAGNLSEDETREAIASLVRTRDGGRGFFVAYLTDERDWKSEPSEATLEALRSSPEIVSELLVKNLAMSTAMAIAHRRNQDERMAGSSARVSRRSAELLERAKLDAAREHARQLHHSAETGRGAYQDFLQSWGYDEEQRQAIARALSEIEGNGEGDRH